MKKKEKTPQKKLSPNDQSREIVEFLSNCEHIRLKLHTAICHGLEKKEIEKSQSRSNKVQDPRLRY